MSDKSETFSEAYNPSVSFADSSLYTREPELCKNFFLFFTREPGLRKGRFQPLHKVTAVTQKLLFCFLQDRRG